MYIYIYTHTHISIYTHTYIHISKYIRIYTYIYPICMYAGLWARRYNFFVPTRKKTVGLRIKPAPVYPHPNPHPIGFLPTCTRVKCGHCHPYSSIPHQSTCMK